jgi:hypothetical protein
VKVPADLRKAFGCEHVNRSLRTDSRSLAVILIEAILLLGGKWVLVGQDTWEADNAYYGRYASTPATRSWRELRCNYWTGRSIQTIEVSGEYNPVPMECPFITSAQ